MIDFIHSLLLKDCQIDLIDEVVDQIRMKLYQNNRNVEFTPKIGLPIIQNDKDLNNKLESHREAIELFSQLLLTRLSG